MTETLSGIRLHRRVGQFPSNGNLDSYSRYGSTRVHLYPLPQSFPMNPAAWDHRQWRVAAAAYISSVVSVAPAVPEFHSTSLNSWSDVFVFDAAHLQDGPL